MNIAKEQTTIRSSLPLFTAWLQDRDRSERTVHAYTDALDRFCHWLEQHHAATTIQEITIRDGTLFRDFLQEGGRSAATINHLLAALAAWGIWAETTGHRRDNPFANLRRIKRTQYQQSPKSLDHRQQAALLRETAHTTNPQRAETILTILLQTGLRISELCALQWRDLHLTERSASLMVRHGKGNQERRIPFSITLRRALWRWAVECYDLAQDEGIVERQRWNQDHATQLMMWIALHPYEPVIASQKGGPLQSRAIQRIIEGLAQRAKLEWVTPHTLRHTYATDLLRHGAQLTDVQVLLGHASITTTSIYTQPRPDHLEQATERLAWE